MNIFNSDIDNNKISNISKSMSFTLTILIDMQEYQNFA